MYLLVQHTQRRKRSGQIFVSVVCLLVSIFSCPVALPQLPETQSELPEGFWADERGVIYRGTPPEGQEKTNGTSDSSLSGFWEDARSVMNDKILPQITWNIGFSFVPAICIFVTAVIFINGLKRSGYCHFTISHIDLFISIWVVCFFTFLTISEQTGKYINMLAGVLFMLNPLFYLTFKSYDKEDKEDKETITEGADQQKAKADVPQKGKRFMLEIFKYLERLQLNANIQQRIVVAIIVPAVIIILSYGFIDIFAKELHSEYITPIEDFDKTWWMWSVALILLGIFEFFWLKTPKR